MLGQLLNLFIDASGHKDYRAPIGGGDTDYYVLGAILVTNEQRHAIEQGLDDVISDLFPHREPRSVELHTSPMMAGEGPWGEITGPLRGEFVSSVRDLLLQVKPLLFAQVVHKQNYWDHFTHIVPEKPAENSLRFLLGRVDKRVPAGSKCRLTLDEDSKEMKTTYADLIADIRENGDKIGGLNFTPTSVTKLNDFHDPHYVDSHASRCLQIADFVAHLCWRATERKQANRLRELDALWSTFYNGTRREPFLSYCPADVTALVHGLKQ